MMVHLRRGDGRDLRGRGLTLGNLHQEFLGAEGGQSAAGLGLIYAVIGSVAVEQAGLQGIGQICGKNLVAMRAPICGERMGKTTSQRSKRLRGIQSALPQ